MRIGFSGHQWRDSIDWQWVRVAISDGLSLAPAGFEGLCSLAAGADQAFARCVHAHGGRVVAVIPRDDYETFFGDAADLASYKGLLAVAVRRIDLHDGGDPQASFFRAGKYITENAHALMVVWDGKPAQGFGGTADIVQLARERGIPVLHIDPLSREIAGGEAWRSLFS